MVGLGGSQLGTTEEHAWFKVKGGFGNADVCTFDPTSSTELCGKAAPSAIVFISWSTSLGPVPWLTHH